MDNNQSTADIETIEHPIQIEDKTGNDGDAEDEPQEIEASGNETVSR